MLATTLPVAAAQPSADHSDSAAFLVYHVAADDTAGTPAADPFVGPTAPAGLNTSREGAVRIGRGATQPDDGRGVPSLVTSWRALTDTQAATPAAFPIRLDARIKAGELTADATWPGSAAQAEWLVSEDGVRHDVDGIARLARHVVREHATQSLADNATSAHWSVPLSPDWHSERVAVTLLLLDDNGTLLQAARWSPQQDGPTFQQRRLILVERATSTACGACARGDEALHVLSADLTGDTGGSAGTRIALTPPPRLAWAGLALGGAAAVALSRWRRAP